MDKATVFALALKAGWPASVLHPLGPRVDTDEFKLVPTLERFAALVAAHEREACAALVKATADACDPGSVLQVYLASEAVAIRSRA